MKAYFISGIGADYRLFTYVRLPQGYEAIYIHWIPPQKTETLPDYAQRLIDQIDTSEPFILIGLSLGGIMSVEIAKRISPVCTIIISSVPLSAQLPGYYKLAGRLGLGRIVPASLLKSATSIKHSLTMKSAANRQLMRTIIRAGDDRFIRWALNAVLNWNNCEIPAPFFHIHGTRDEVFPISLTNPTHIIPKGGHMFLMSRPDIVNDILRQILSTLTLPAPHPPLAYRHPNPFPANLRAPLAPFLEIPLPLPTSGSGDPHSTVSDPKPDTRLLETGRSYIPS